MHDVFNTTFKDRFKTQQHDLLLALLGLYSGPDSRHLNFYGPPQTITTIPYARILASDNSRTGETTLPDLQGKAVFVGYSERLHPEQLNEFYTVFSQDTGLNLSEVEIEHNPGLGIPRSNQDPLPPCRQPLLDDDVAVFVDSI